MRAESIFLATQSDAASKPSISSGGWDSPPPVSRQREEAPPSRARSSAGRWTAGAAAPPLGLLPPPGGRASSAAAGNARRTPLGLRLSGPLPRPHPCCGTGRPRQLLGVMATANGERPARGGGETGEPSRRAAGGGRALLRWGCSRALQLRTPGLEKRGQVVPAREENHLHVIQV